MNYILKVKKSVVGIKRKFEFLSLFHLLGFYISNREDTLLKAMFVGPLNVQQNFPGYTLKNKLFYNRAWSKTMDAYLKWKT